MAIINGTRQERKEKIKIEISSSVYEEITNYCKWADINDLSSFFQEAACFVFSKDKEWKAKNRPTKRAYNKKTTPESV